MKKMRQLLGAVICVLMATSFAYAEVPEKPIHIYLQGGGTLPMSDLKDGWKVGFNVGGGIGLSINENIEVGARVLYNSLNLDTEGDLWKEEGGDMDDVDGGEFQPLMYGLELKINTGNEDTNLYIVGGFGKAKVKFGDLEVNGQEVDFFEEQTENYYALGGGVEFGTFFIEARYVIIKFDGDGSDSDDIKMIPVSVGIKF